MCMKFIFLTNKRGLHKESYRSELKIQYGEIFLGELSSVGVFFTGGICQPYFATGKGFKSE